MSYPTPSDYVEALQFPDAAFADPDLAAGRVDANALGLPQPITGAFAVVFSVRTDAGRVAVRAFVTPQPDRAARYRAVEKHLAAHPVPAFVPFAYREDGLRVNGRAWPMVRMPWTEGVSLEAFVAEHRADPAMLDRLAEAWRALLAELAEAGMAHGDLQHGNVLVALDGDAPALRLVDPDAAFVPALAGRGAAEVGHRNYQHPDRTEAHFDASLDHFAGLVVYTALAALRADASLWDRFSTGENLLFRSEDFYDPEASALFAALSEIEAVRPLAEALARACYLDPRAVPSLEAVLSGEAVEGGAVRRREREAGRPARREGIARRGGAAALGITGLFVVGLATGSVALLFVAVIAFGGWGLAVFRAHRRLSVVRRRRRLAREAAVLDRWIADLRDEQRGVLDQQRHALDHLDRLRAERLAELRDEALHAVLKHHFIGELSHDEAVGHTAVIRLKQAGIRTAFHATPERVAAARDLSPSQREAVAAWRDAYAEAADVPEALSPTEERRLRRSIERRRDELTAEAARLEARIAVQAEERARLTAQAEALPDVSLATFGRYVLRLGSLPEARPVAVPAAAPREPVEPTASSSGSAWWDDHP